MIDRSRRRLLLTVVAPLFAGCTARERPTTKTEQSKAGSLATPTDSCPTVSRPDGDYPALPADLTAESAKRYVLLFEKEYARATVASRPDTNFDGFDGRESELWDETGTGYVLTVEVAVDYSMASAGETGTDLGSETFRSWYYVTASAVLRTDRQQSDRMPQTGWDTVACR